VGPKIRQVIVVTLAFALSLRIAWILIEPIVPLLIVVAGLTVVAAVLFRRSE
jgi:hypothetical protein